MWVFSEYSPRPWGWTVAARDAARRRGVLPTPVGMDRRGRRANSTRPCIPHARGDGPQHERKAYTITMYSPRPWGWTVLERPPLPPRGVFPTPVGMDRSHVCPHRRGRCIPHARGDGPVTFTAVDVKGRYSPRPWGWTERHDQRRVWDPVFPTPVGMDRGGASARLRSCRIPHARADGPDIRDELGDLKQYSPRPWGWTGRTQGRGRGCEVFPTPVGMDRRLSAGPCRNSCIPHARGDGPQMMWHSSYGGWYSPRPWGWTGRSSPIDRQPCVFPTPVGMNRNSAMAGHSSSRIPHARGDGPSCA